MAAFRLQAHSERTSLHPLHGACRHENAPRLQPLSPVRRPADRLLTGAVCRIADLATFRVCRGAQGSKNGGNEICRCRYQPDLLRRSRPTDPRDRRHRLPPGNPVRQAGPHDRKAPVRQTGVFRNHDLPLPEQSAGQGRITLHDRADGIRCPRPADCTHGRDPSG